MARFCANCGEALGEGNRFCPACGSSVGGRQGLVRPRQGRKIAGVCQGLANRFGWDVVLVRVIAVILAIALFPLGVAAYLIFWLLVPGEKPALPSSPPLNPAERVY
jgi:phage shock protein C